MSAALTVISSMATKQVLADLVAAFERESPLRVAVESVGGVDAARRVQDGEAFDLVVLAAAAVDQLIAAGRVAAGSRTDLVLSGVAVAVASNAPLPDIGSEDAVKRAVLAARSVGFSTGPSGVHLARVFARWGIRGGVGPRLVQAPPGVSVASLVARGEAEIGFQQLSELLNVPGITVVGPAPAGVQIVTTFSAGRLVGCTRGAEVQALLDFLTSPAADAAKRANGMAPA